MKRSYRHLTQAERYHIETPRKQNVSLGEIAWGMNRNKSSVSRELKRNTGQRGHRHQQAHHTAQQRHKDKPKAKKMLGALLGYVMAGLKKHWSQEQICDRLKHESQASLSHLCPVGMKRFIVLFCKIKSPVVISTPACATSTKNIVDAMVKRTVVVGFLNGWTLTNDLRWSQKSRDGVMGRPTP